MGVVRFSENGYEYLDTSSYVLFTEDNSHFHLFDYVASDLSELPKLTEGYISKIMDTTTLQLRRDRSDSSGIYEIQKLLKASHPYYRYEADKVIVEAIGSFFNRLLVYTCFNRSHNLTGNIFPRDWYQKRISALIPKSLLRHGEYPPGNSPEELYLKYHDWIGPPPSVDDTQIEEYFVVGVPEKRPTPFSDELYTQSFVSNMLYLILDLSAKGMEKLNIQQRYWLFGNIFHYDYSSSNLGATRRLSFFRQACFRANHDRSDEVKYLCALDDLFRPLYKLSGLNIDRDGIEESMNAAFAAVIDRAKQEVDAKVYEEYEIDNLQQLLYLEIMAMIHEGITIKKCNNCRKYFVPANRKRVYCDRIDSSGIRCAAVGQKTSFQRKMKQEPALAVYNRAYKTHYARHGKGTMSPTDFEKWCREAKEKLAQVRAGELDLSNFQTWLKQ